MGKSKASKRKTDISGGDLEGSTRAKRYELKLFSIQPPDLIRVGLSISFGIAKIFKVGFSSPLHRFAANSSANPQLRAASVFIYAYGWSTGKSASHVTLSFQFLLSVF